MHFESAAKLYSEAGDNAMAVDAYLKYAKCAEKEDAMHSAADGYAQAANHEKDIEKAKEYLGLCKFAYATEGKPETGLKVIMKLLKKEYEIFE